MSTELNTRPEAYAYRQEQERRQSRRHLQTMLKEATREGHRAISRGDRISLERVVEDAMCPLLGVQHAADVRSIRRILLDRGVDCPSHGLRTVLRDGAENVRGDLLVEAFRSLETISRELKHDSASLETSQPVIGYETQLGVRYLRAESAEGGPLEVYDPDDDLKAILFAGSQGAGKTTARKTLLEDRIAAGHKVVDVIDFHKAENSTFDIPEQDEDLRKWRNRLSMDVGFEEYDPPNVEVLAPLTPGLDASLVPIDEVTGECVLQPFTIPASELSYRQLIMVLPHTTKTHENYIKAAHQRLSNADVDWTLRDMAVVVRRNTNAGDKVADRIERSLETAQNKSFIRDEDADYQLDWRGMMADADTVSAFTVHTVREWTDKLLVVSYLLDKLYEVRNQLLAQTRDIEEYPILTLGLGELHAVAPRHKAEQNQESTIEGYMIDTLSDLFALMRHANVEIVADTQRFHQQLAPEVSTLFHEIYAFEGQKPDVKKIFQTRVDTTDPVETVSQYETGICSHVSGNGYTLPIRFAPPRSHHLDAKRDGDGLSFRTTIDEGVKLEPSPWSSDIPERLAFGESTPDIQRFFDECVEKTNDEKDYIERDRLVAAYDRWRSDGDREYQDQYIKEALKDYFEADPNETLMKPRIRVNDHSKRPTADKGFKLVKSAFSVEDREYLFGEGWECRVWPELSDETDQGRADGKVVRPSQP